MNASQQPLTHVNRHVLTRCLDLPVDAKVAMLQTAETQQDVFVSVHIIPFGLSYVSSII